MRYIGKSKISKINPKPNISYPLLRLPQAFNDFIGKTTNVFETENEGKQAFLVVLDKNSEAEQASFQVMQLVMQLEAVGIRQNTENCVEARLSALENGIKEIKQSLFQNKNIFELKNENEVKINAEVG